MEEPRVGLRFLPVEGLTPAGVATFFTKEGLAPQIDAPLTA